MRRHHSELNRLAVLVLPVLCALLLAACNVTGLPAPVPAPTSALAPPTPTVAAPLPTATNVAQLPPTTAPTTRPASSPNAKPTTARATSTPEPVPTRTQAVPPTRTAAPKPSAAPPSSPTATTLPEHERLAIFDEVWDTVDTNYLYKDFHGADWDALRDRYRPLAGSATTSTEFYDSIAQMIDELKDDHSRYLSPTAAREEDSLQEGNASYVGIGVISAPEEKSLTLIYVFPGSPADKAGLKRRDRITAVDGTPFNDARTDTSRIRGPKGTQVVLTVTSPGASPREVTLTRDTISGAIEPSASRLEADPSIAYLVIPDLWTNNMGQNVHEKLQEIVGATEAPSGIVIDLRGNGGGFRTVLESVLSEFVQGQVGRFFDQADSYPFIIRASALNRRLTSIPVVVLVDSGTESYAEVLAAVLQSEGRAKVVGVQSAGNTETIFQYNYDDGSRLWLAQEGFRLPDDTNLEGRGVIPDFAISADWATYPEKTDPHILKAIEIIKGKQ